MKIRMPAVFKVQRPIMTTGGATFLVYDEQRQFIAELSKEDGLSQLLDRLIPDETLKTFIEIKVVEGDF